jgi:HAD superfamily hydrolase (TIGR01459 family)
MQALNSLDDVIDRYDALLCDIWGVIHNGRTAYVEAHQALARARATGKTVILISNVPKPRDPIPRQLDRYGVPREAWDAIVTSGDAIRDELVRRAPGPMYKIGPSYDRELWDGLGLAYSELGSASFIGISGLNDEQNETPADYAETLAIAKSRNLDMLCANPDIVVQAGDKLIWCAGAIAREYEKLGGRVIMAGKPFAPIYELAYRELEKIGGKRFEKSRLLAIGDGIPTDLKGADDQKIDCLFIASGMHGEKLKTSGVLDAAKVESALAEEKARATYVMGALA